MIETHELLSWHQSSWQLLQHYIEHDRVPQALLISGVKGLDKCGLAELFTFRLLCPQPQDNGLPCGNCKSCLLLQAHNHPDYQLIQPEDDKKSIGIAQIRQILAETSLKPHYESYRVILITPAELMTISAFNSFLKVLEEPNERTIFILLTEKIQKIPATIRSRCQKITIKAPNQDDLTEWFKQQNLLADKRTVINLVVRSLLDISQIKESNLLNIREACFNDWMAISKHRDNPTSIAEKWLKYPMLDVTGWLLSWISDVVISGFNTPKINLCNQDFSPHLQKLSQTIEIKALFKHYDALLAFRTQLDSPLNLQLALEEILIQWQNLTGETRYE